MTPKGAQLDPSVLLELVAGKGVGTKVRYWPVWMIEYQQEFVDTVTTSNPWQLGHGEWVVNIGARSGGCAVSRMRILPATPSTALNEYGPKWEQ